MNILTFDIEEWFHLLEYSGTKNEEQWDKFEVRIHENVERILNILEKTNTKATFFVIGWIAKKYPELIKKISEKYEIGSHTTAHQLVWELDKEKFKQDLDISIKTIQDTTGKPVKYFRAPGFSISDKNAWAFDTICDSGIEIDCSIFPAKHAHGGMPGFTEQGPCIIEYCGKRIKELPMNHINIMGKPIIFSGGGYFRFFPYWLIKHWTNKNDYNIAYMHPRDFDANQPVLEGLSLTRRFKSYTGLKGAGTKLQKYLTNFKFIDIAAAKKQIDWEKVPIIKL